MAITLAYDHVHQPHGLSSYDYTISDSCRTGELAPCTTRDVAPTKRTVVQGEGRGQGFGANVADLEMPKGS